jgi:hypothetical protein
VSDVAIAGSTRGSFRLRRTERTPALAGGRSGAMPQFWQRNYYEPIMRGEAEQDRIHLYIEANVDNRGTDEESPTRPGRPRWRINRV